MIVAGLHGGLGNCLFMLPALTALARSNQVSLYVAGDYPMAALWQRCAMARSVWPHPRMVAARAPGRWICGQYSPPLRRHWQRCGWPEGTRAYPHPEWAQIKRLACGDMSRENVTGWIQDLQPGPAVDVGLIPGCKPGGEWARKRWPGMAQLAAELRAAGCSIASFGQAEEIEEAGLRDVWTGPQPLERLPDLLAGCRVVVGTDSGVAHLASSLGVPVVMLFTATCPTKGDPVGQPELVRKLTLRLPCAPCQSTPRWRECGEWQCRQIPVAAVFAAAMALGGLSGASTDSLPIIPAWDGRRR